MKNPKLTTEQEQQLHAFIGKCVLNGVLFKSFRMGVQNTTIQDIVSGLSVEGMAEYIEKLEELVTKTTSSRLDKIAGTSRKAMIGQGVTADELADIILLLIMRRKNIDEVKDTRRRINTLNAQLLEHRTPDQVRADLTKELADLQAEVE